MSFTLPLHHGTHRFVAVFRHQYHRISTSSALRGAKMQICGRLAEAPKIIETSTGKDVVQYLLGTDYGRMDNKQISWWRVTAFLEEGALKQHMLGLSKGTLLFIDAHCTKNKYKNKAGNEQFGLNIVQRSIQVVEPIYKDQSQDLPRPKDQSEGPAKPEEISQDLPNPKDQSEGPTKPEDHSQDPARDGSQDQSKTTSEV